MKAIKAKYISPTATRPSRIKAWDSDGNQVHVSPDSSFNTDSNYRAAVTALCRKMNWTGTLAEGGWRRGEQVYVFVEPHTTFEA